MAVEGLGEGDYAIRREGELLPVRIERKTLNDFFGCVGQSRERFEAELERLRQYQSWLIIESHADEIRAGFVRSRVSGEAALGSAIHWAGIFGIHVVFTGNRHLGQRICQQALEEFAIHG